jgi:transaldolase
VSLEVVASDFDGMMKEGKELAQVAPNVVVKCPLTRDGLKAVKQLAASIRSPLHVLDAAKAGAHVATMPFSVLEMLVKHPLTDIGLKKFLDDWNKSGATISAEAM